MYTYRSSISFVNALSNSSCVTCQPGWLDKEINNFATVNSGPVKSCLRWSHVLSFRTRRALLCKLLLRSSDLFFSVKPISSAIFFDLCSLDNISRLHVFQGFNVYFHGFPPLALLLFLQGQLYAGSIFVVISSRGVYRKTMWPVALLSGYLLSFWTSSSISSPNIEVYLRLVYLLPSFLTSSWGSCWGSPKR